MTKEDKNNVELEMKASADLNSRISEELMLSDPSEEDAAASIKEFTKQDADDNSD